MALYDLRFPFTSSTLWRGPPSPGNPTKPYITYPAYVNEHFETRDLDVSTSLGMIATATNLPSNRYTSNNKRGYDRYPCQVSFLDLWTGKTLLPEPPPDGKPIYEISNGPPVVKFFYSEEQMGGMDEIGGPPLGMLVGTHVETKQWNRFTELR